MLVEDLNIKLGTVHERLVEGLSKDEVVETQGGVEIATQVLDPYTELELSYKRRKEGIANLKSFSLWTETFLKIMELIC